MLADHRRMKRDAAIGCVEGLSAPPRLGVDRTPGNHEGWNIGDRVTQQIAFCAPLYVHGLVEVGGALRIDRHEGDGGEIELGLCDLGDGSSGLGLDLGRKGDRQRQIVPDGGDGRGERVAVGVGQPERGSGHGPRIRVALV